MFSVAAVKHIRGVSRFAVSESGDHVSMPETEQLAHKPINHPALTTPCTALALRNWLQSLEGVASGDFWETQVTTTATSITVA